MRQAQFATLRSRSPAQSIRLRAAVASVIVLASMIDSLASARNSREPQKPRRPPPAPAPARAPAPPVPPPVLITLPEDPPPPLAPVPDDLERYARVHRGVTGVGVGPWPRNELGEVDRERISQEIQSDLALLAEGKKVLLVRALMHRDAFTKTRFRAFLSMLSNEERRRYEEPDDYQIMIARAFWEDLDFRRLFSETIQVRWERASVGFSYVPPTLDSRSVRLGPLSSSTRLSFVTPRDRPEPGRLQTASIAERLYSSTEVTSDTGLLSSVGFSRRFLEGGTNRRPVRAVFDIFLCAPIETWRDASITDIYVGRDIDRNPGGDPNARVNAYQTDCRSCHVMDSYRGAWALHDYDPERRQATVSASVVPKYALNSHRYEDGHPTLDVEWENVLVGGRHDEFFGWEGPSRGRSLASFGRLIANSRRFRECMARRALETMCPSTDAIALDRGRDPRFLALADGFAANGYKLAPLFSDAYMSEVCR